MSLRHYKQITWQLRTAVAFTPVSHVEISMMKEIEERLIKYQ
jgi:hypothetical protein